MSESTSTIAARLAELNLVLPPVPAPGGNYAPAVQTGRLVFLSGAIGTTFLDGRWSLPLRGKLGRDLTIEQGQESARLCMLNHLAALHTLLGGLERVSRVVKLTGHVHAADGFTKAPLVLDGASNLLVSLFGNPGGLHARAVTYQHTMSFDAPIETDLIVELDGG